MTFTNAHTKLRKYSGKIQYHKTHKIQKIQKSRKTPIIYFENLITQGEFA